MKSKKMVVDAPNWIRENEMMDELDSEVELKWDVCQIPTSHVSRPGAPLQQSSTLCQLVQICKWNGRRS
jgi:hypothetical protein